MSDYDVKVMGRVIGIGESLDANPTGREDQQVGLDEHSSQLMIPGGAPYREIVRRGRAFQTHTSAAQAAVVAIPTVGISLGLYNMASEGGRSLVIDWIAASNVVSTAVVAQAQMLALVGQLEESTAPTDAALAITKLNGYGQGQPDTVARTTTANLPATTGVAANWFPLGPSTTKPSAVATPGYGLWVPVDGRIIIPPHRFFAVNVIANVVGETFLSYIGWHELSIGLG